MLLTEEKKKFCHEGRKLNDVHYRSGRPIICQTVEGNHTLVYRQMCPNCSDDVQRAGPLNIKERAWGILWPSRLI